MTDQKRVLLLPGPDSARAAVHYFGTGYDYASYLTDNYHEAGAAFVTNAELQRFANCEVDFWQTPLVGRSESLVEGPTSVIRHLVQLGCSLRVVSFGLHDEQYEPMACHRAGIDRQTLIDWARAHIRAWDTSWLEEDETAPRVPRETSTERGHPRSRADGSPPAGVQFEGNTGSVFVSWDALGLAAYDGKPPHPNLDNIQKILAHHPDLVGKIWYDEFHGKVFQSLFQDEPAEWADHHDTRLTIWIQRNLRLHKMGHALVRLAVESQARLSIRNEVREWMEGLEWDEEERLPTLMSDAFGAAQDDYTSAVGRCWMVSMAARTYQPGCKVDAMPVFEGPEGLRKSTALSIIGGKWYSEMHEDITTKDFLQNLPGNLLIEIAELHAFRRGDIKKIKGIISNPSDRYRASYARRPESHPRRGVWSGTTNQDGWVEDDTGARRFWPIACTAIDLDYLHGAREQLFAEAVHRYKRGESWWDINATLAKQEQDARREEDPWTLRILSYCEGKPEVTVGEIMNQALEIPLVDRGKMEQMRVASILRVAGFVRKQQWLDGRNVKVWLTKT